MIIVNKLKAKHVGAGHRKRLRDRFLQSGLDGFLDYEIVELLLTLGTPMKDCKQMAKNAITKFGGLRGALDASLEDLREIKGIGPSNAFGVKLFQAIAERYAKEKIPSKISLRTPKEVSEYCREKLGREKKEHFLVIYLDSANNVISIKDISIGILNSSLVHPREVFEPAIKLLAAHIIVVHNHPSGDLEPSIDDLKITQRLISVGELTGIDIIDHLIVSSNGYTSLREKGVM
jgi:DNA repair protein RadC